MVSVIN